MVRAVLDPKRLLTPTDLPRLPIALLVGSAIAVAVGAYEHAHLFHHDYGTPLIRTLFLLNAIASLATILLLVARRPLPYLLGALTISGGAIVAIIITHSSHLLGFYEAAWTTEAKITIAAEIAAVVLALAGLVTGRGTLAVALAAPVGAPPAGTPAPSPTGATAAPDDATAPPTAATAPPTPTSDPRLRIVAGAVVTIVLGGAILGVAQGGPPGGGGSAPTRAQRDAAAQRLAALGPVAREGRAVFLGDSGCGGCHRLADAGTSAAVGPDLDRVLAGRSSTRIRQDIVDPAAEIAAGFPKGLMPGDFGKRLSPKQLDALVRYLVAATATR